MTVEDPDDPGRCICCGLPLNSCGKYTEELAAAARRRDARRGGREVEAEYGGVCVDCRTPFPAGTLIEWDAEEDGWRSLECCP